ncbi:MerR family transcriptional regulator [Granulicella sp. S156]|uniref:helix-turn-helix domain-containing protein n=1 Tax=Granulicella sp. S156 TaxID=1747224 RepID=UPI00131D0D18|nr:MerR family transcriptional regulator [Granulicella sp. S156]
MMIGEVAKIAGLSKDGIRHYEKLGLITSTARQAGSKVYRDYDASVLHTIEQIRGAQHFLRLSLNEIGPLFKALEDTPPTDAQRLEYLKERLVVVRKQILSLREVEDHLSGKISRLRKELARARKLVASPVAGSECRDPGNTRPPKSPPRRTAGLGAYRSQQVQID